jgi:uncharacterized protein DUF2834
VILRSIYLALAIVAAIAKVQLFLQVPGDGDYGLMGIMQDWRLGLLYLVPVWEILIASAALTIWMLAEVYVRKDYWVAPVCIAATFGLGLSVGLPLYLYLRTRPVQ